MSRAGVSLIELMLVIALLEVLVLHVPELLRHVTRVEHRAGAALDAAAVRAGACARLRADLDAAAGARAFGPIVVLAGRAGCVVWATTSGALLRVGADDARVAAWPAATSPGARIDELPGGRLLAFPLAIAGAPLCPSRLWGRP